MRRVATLRNPIVSGSRLKPDPITSQLLPNTDPVNRPSHYASGWVECIDAIEASMSEEEFQGYCKGNLIKYTWRYRDKGGVQDLRKANWYLDRLIKTHETHND